jgi:oligopeptide transport system ATP-binding protein
LAKNGTAKGSVTFDGHEILNAPVADLNALRSNQIAMVFQDPMTALNPYMRVADQMAEGLIHHKGMSKGQAHAECLRMLDAVQIPDAKGRISLYPHEFSGGMRQRILIAMSLLCKPDLLIADEPTTALDVTVQAQIMHLLRDLQRDFGMATMLITHDLGVIAGFCQDVIVLYGGQIMEKALVDPLFYQPTHPYTRGLLRAIPRVDQIKSQLDSIPGSPPNMMRDMIGCPFAPRCQFAIPICSQAVPPLTKAGTDLWRACHRPVEALA